MAQHSHTHPPQRTLPQQPLYQPDYDEMPTEWREFAAGMAFLRRYGTHNTANTSAIGRDNLRLLHRSLLQKDDYRQKLSQARQQTKQHNRPNKTTLVVSQQLSAQLIRLPKQSSIQLIVGPGEHAMFMILSGAASTSSQQSTHCRTHWWPQDWPLGHHSSGQSRLLKTDDIISITQTPSTPCILSTHNKSCVVLAVFDLQGNAQKLPPSEPRLVIPTEPALISQTTA